MKKTTLSILSLTALLALTGCSSTLRAASASEGSVAQSGPVFLPDEIELNSRSTSLFVGETYQISTLITPLVAAEAKLSYRSSNSDIASVSDAGLVTAVSDGDATITVYATDKASVSMDLLVHVMTPAEDTSKINSVLTTLKRYQKQRVKTPRNLLTYETETRSVYVDGTLKSQSVSYEKFVVSKDQALFYVGGRDTERRIPGADPVRSSFGYYVFTDSDYHSYIYHHTDYAKNRCLVNTEFYLGTEVTADQVVYKILDSLFNSGSDLAEDTIEDAMGTDWFTYPNMVKQYAVSENGTDSYMGSYAQSITDEESTPLMEQNLDIPAYIPYDENDSFKVYFYKGNVKSYFVNFQISYNYGGKAHKLDIKREYTFLRDDEFTVEFPDAREYTAVADIFDL